MNEQNELTIGFLKKVDEYTSLNLNINEFPLQKLEKKKNYLIIRTESKRFLKLMVYPVENDVVYKLSLIGTDIPNESLDYLSEIFEKFNVIHNSGLVLNENRSQQEIYIDERNFREKLNKNIKSIEGLKVIINEINIE